MHRRRTGKPHARCVRAELSSHTDSSLLHCSRAKELSSSFGGRVPFSRLPERKEPKRGAPRLALAGHPVRQVRESGAGFSSGLLPARKGESIHGLARCAACRPRFTAAQGTPGRAAGRPGPHSVMKLRSRSHSKASLCCGFSEKCTQDARCSTGPCGAAHDFLLGDACGSQDGLPVEVQPITLVVSGWRQPRPTNCSTNGFLGGFQFSAHSSP